MCSFYWATLYMPINNNTSLVTLCACHQQYKPIETTLKAYQKHHEAINNSASISTTLAAHQQHYWLEVAGGPQRPVTKLKPNTHRRRRRDETVLSRRIGVGGVYMNSQLAHDDC